MNRNIIQSNLIPKDRLKALQERSDAAGLSRFLPQVTLFVASAVSMVVFSHLPAVFLPSLVVNILVQFGMFGMLHEACHQTAFERRNLNLLAGWVAALAQPMTPALMRAFHFEHHRHTHELERDPELAGMAWMQAWPRHVMWLVSCSGLPILMARSGWALFAALVPTSLDAAWNAALPFVKASKRKRIAWEARGLVALHGSLITTAVLWLPALSWYYVAMAGSHVLLSFYTTCEHRGLPADGDILERTRSLKAPAWLRWLLWNMPYHAEHHAWPAVPFHRLGDVHEAIREDLPHHVSPVSLHWHRGAET